MGRDAWLTIACGLVLAWCCARSAAQSAELVAITITPHVQSENLRWRRPPNPQRGVRAELFLQNKSSAAEMLTATSGDVRFDGSTPAELTASQQWAWHDTPDVWGETGNTLPPDALTVLRFNTRIDRWGLGTTHQLEMPGAAAQEVSFAKPDAWLSAVTFLREKDVIRPTRMVVHVANQHTEPLRIKSCKLWLPASKATRHVFQRSEAVRTMTMFPADGVLAPGEKGGFLAQCDPLPLTYGVVEVKITTAGGAARSLFTHVRIKGEQFDIGGECGSGRLWLRGTPSEPFLKTLKRMHLNTAHIVNVPGYTDNPGLYAQYPLKLFGRLFPPEEYDHEEMLFTIHGVDCVGKPQYGGRRPLEPQEVWQALLPYQRTCVPTTLTHSEERVWRLYAGLADFPHFDAGRVVAPAADAWTSYDRWGETRIRWGAPLETIGDMTRSLRELNRPAPIACWSQASHDSWNTVTGRVRNAPMPNELRAQAYQALANRVTSLYWFSLNHKSLVKYPDLIAPISRVGREIRLIDQILLEGDAYEYRREMVDGQPAWDLNSIAAPTAAVLFANDLTYRVDAERGVFVFPPARQVELTFRLPAWLPTPAEIFRVSAEGIEQPVCEVRNRQVTIHDSIEVAGIYVVARDEGLRERTRAKLAALVATEQAIGFDPGGNTEDFRRLEEHR